MYGYRTTFETQGDLCPGLLVNDIVGDSLIELYFNYFGIITVVIEVDLSKWF